MKIFVKQHIRLAKEAQEHYEHKINEEEICEKIKNDIIKNIKEEFAPILVENDEINTVIDIDLLNLSTATSFIERKNSMSGYYQEINGRFLSSIENFLYKTRVIELKKRFDDFANDIEFMKYLEANNLYLLLGAKDILKNRDYRMNSKYGSVTIN